MWWNWNLFTGSVPALAGLIALWLKSVFEGRKERETQRRNGQANHYKKLLFAISDTTSRDTDAVRRLGVAINTIGLVAPQDVVNAAMDFHVATRPDAQCSDAVHDEALKKLVLAIRKDLNIRPKDDPLTFKYHLIDLGSPRE